MSPSELGDGAGAACFESTLSLISDRAIDSKLPTWLDRAPIESGNLPSRVGAGIQV